MKISVIIPVYNRVKKVKKAVDSVLKQTYLPEEIIIVDDGSSEDVESEIKGHDWTVSRETVQRKVKVLSQSNKGVASARNFGIEHSGGEWLAFLDSDDWWLPEKLAAQVEFHRQNTSFLISQTDEIWIRNGRRVNPRKYHLKPEGDIFTLSLSRCLISPSSVLLSRELLNKVGFFDENLPVCEDYDLWLRITCFYKVGLIREKLVVKTGGHLDQLSKKYWGMDRFRVKSLQKLIKKGCLSPEQEKAAKQKLNEKLAILQNGARKRGKLEAISQYRAL